MPDPSKSKDVVVTQFMTRLSLEWNPMYPSSFHDTLTINDLERIRSEGGLTHLISVTDEYGVIWDLGNSLEFVPRGTSDDGVDKDD